VPAATVNPVAAPPTPKLFGDNNREDTAPLLVSSPVARAAAPPVTPAPSMTPTAFTTPARHGGLGQSGATPELATALGVLATMVEGINTAQKAHAAERAEAETRRAEAEKAHAAERAEDRNLIAHITNAHAAERAEAEKAHAAERAESLQFMVRPGNGPHHSVEVYANFVVSRSLFRANS
jgi:hypothetical protein